MLQTCGHSDSDFVMHHELKPLLSWHDILGSSVCNLESMTPKRQFLDSLADPVEE